MARLTGEAARKWLAENPGKGYYNAKTGSYVEPERSGVANFLLGMSKPLRMVGGLSMEAMQDLANAAAKTRGQEVPYADETRRKAALGLTGTETAEMREDPWLAAGKSAAGIASYFVPAGAAAKAVGSGAKIASATARGLGAGALGGFGYSKKGEEVSGTLGGAALGGVLGGTLQGVGELAKRGTKDINKLRKEAFKSAGVVDDASQLRQGVGITRGNYVDDIELLQRGQKSDAVKDYLVALRDKGLVDEGQVKTLLKYEYGVEPSTIGVGKGLPKVGDQELRSYGVKNDAYNKISGGSERAKRGVGAIKAEAKELGVSLADRYSKERALKPVMESLSAKVDDLAKGMAPEAKTSILKQIDDAIREIPEFSKNDAYQRINNILKQYGDELTGPELRGLYQEIANAGKVYSLSPASKAKTSEIYTVARDTVRSYFKGDAGREISKIADIYEVAPFIKRQAGTEWGPNLFGIQFRPVMGTKVVDRLGGAITGTPRVASSVGGRIGDIASPIAGMAQRRGVIPGLVGLGAQREPQQEISGTSGVDSGSIQQMINEGLITSEEAQLMSEQTTQPAYTYIDAITEAQQRFPNAPESTILSMAKFLMDQHAGPELDQGAISNIQQALSIIDELGGSAAGKIGTVTGKIGEFFGAETAGTRYRSIISSLRTELIKRIAGTAQTPAEMRNLVDRLPQPTDEPAVARVKLEVLLGDEMRGSMQNQTNPSTNEYEDYLNY